MNRYQSQDEGFAPTDKRERMRARSLAAMITVRSLTTLLISGFFALAALALPNSAHAQPCFPEGSLIKEYSSAPVWVIHRCVKFWVPNQYELDVLGGWGRVRWVPDGTLASVPHIPADNTMWVERTFPQNVQVVIAGASYGALYDSQMFAQLGGWANVIEIPLGSMWATPPGSGLTPVSWYPLSGTMIRERSRAPVWVVYDEIGYWVSDQVELDWLLGWANVHLIPDQIVAPFRRCPADGTLLNERTQAPVWVVYGCTRYWVSDPTELSVLGGWSQVKQVPNRSVTQNPPNYWPPVNSWPPEGARLTERTTRDIYMIVAGAKFYIPPSEYPYFVTSDIRVQTVPYRALTSAPTGFNPIPNAPANGTAFRWRSGTTSYIFDGGWAYPISNPNDCPEQVNVVPDGSSTFLVAPGGQTRQMSCAPPIG